MDSNILGIRDLMELSKFLDDKEIDSTIKESAIYYINNAFIIDQNKIRPYKKAPEITLSMILHDMKLLETMKNKYIPIYDMHTKKLLFTREEFLSYRKKMSGLKEYDTGIYIFSDNLYFDGLDYYLEQIDQNKEKVDSYRNPIYQEIIKVISSLGLSVSIGCNSGGDVELVEAGSTARYTNIPSIGENKKWDFDFTVRFHPENTWKVKEILETKLKAGGHITRTSKFKVRLIDVEVPGVLEKVDLDFSLTPQKEKYLSTEDAINERLENMKNIDEQKYRLVLANIMYAKDMLKKYGAYKPSRGILEGDRQKGGLGGVGIENWILQNGGSLIDATNEFLMHAEGKKFIEFEKEYAIMDFGANHVGKSKNNWPYDNFIINNMRYLGFEKMRECLQKFISNLNISHQESHNQSSHSHK